MYQSSNKHGAKWDATNGAITIFIFKMGVQKPTNIYKVRAEYNKLTTRHRKTCHKAECQLLSTRECHQLQQEHC